MKKVLLTNFQFKNLTGSEIDTKTVAEYFLKNKWDVTIFTFTYGYPLINELDSRIKIIDCTAEHLWIVNMTYVGLIIIQC